MRSKFKAEAHWDKFLLSQAFSPFLPSSGGARGAQAGAWGLFSLLNAAEHPASLGEQQALEHLLTACPSSSHLLENPRKGTYGKEKANTQMNREAKQCKK